VVVLRAAAVAGLTCAGLVGNPTRNKNTQAMIDAYMKANPDVKISGQPGEFDSYWDKLATQTAGGQAPDIIQMDMNYISEYGTRDALLDLSSVDTSKFVEGTSIQARSTASWSASMPASTARHLANPKVFEKAKMDLPDDKTWTWDQLIELVRRSPPKRECLRRGAGCRSQTHCSARSCASMARSSSPERAWV
jgi:ABC-type glycerol-3-phosphate transport system substrate-binding protein